MKLNDADFIILLPLGLPASQLSAPLPVFFTEKSDLDAHNTYASSDKDCSRRASRETRALNSVMNFILDLEIKSFL